MSLVPKYIWLLKVMLDIYTIVVVIFFSVHINQQIRKFFFSHPIQSLGLKTQWRWDLSHKVLEEAGLAEGIVSQKGR